MGYAVSQKEATKIRNSDAPFKICANSACISESEGYTWSAKCTHCRLCGSALLEVKDRPLPGGWARRTVSQGARRGLLLYYEDSLDPAVRNRTTWRRPPPPAVLPPIKEEEEEEEDDEEEEKE